MGVTLGIDIGTSATKTLAIDETGVKTEHGTGSGIRERIDWRRMAGPAPLDP